MSNQTIIDSYIVQLTIIQQSILRYGYLIIFILGNIGSILNILILTRRNYLKNSCSSYILASSLPNLLIINIVILTRILAAFNYDLTIKSNFFCKFQWYIVHGMTIISRTYILLACIDRWVMTSTSIRRRAFAQIKVALKIIPITGILWSIISTHVLVYQDIQGDRCLPSTTGYAIFFNSYNIILTGLLIPIFMIIFSILTIKNVKSLQKRIHPSLQIFNELNNRLYFINKKTNDYQLIFIVFVQQCVYIITTTPFAIFSFYTIISIDWIKSNLDLAIENICSAFVYTLVLTNFCMTFYIYILTSQTFRRDLRRLFKCRNRQIGIQMRMKIFVRSKTINQINLSHKV